MKSDNNNHDAALLRTLVTGELARGLTHGVSNSLSAAASFAGFLQEDLPKDSKEHEFAVHIGKAAQKGLELVQAFRSFSRNELATNLERTYDLNNLVFALIELLSHVTHSTSNVATQYSDLPLRSNTNRAALSDGLLLMSLVGLRAISQSSQRKVYWGLSNIESVESFWAAGFENSVFLHVPDPCAGKCAAIKAYFEGSDYSLSATEESKLVAACEQTAWVMPEVGLACQSTSEGLKFVLSVPLAPEADRFAEKSLRPIRTLLIGPESELIDSLTVGLEREGLEAACDYHADEAIAICQDAPNSWDALVLVGISETAKIEEIVSAISKVNQDIKSVWVLSSATKKMEKLVHVDKVVRPPLTPQELKQLLKDLLA